ncbi:MAG: type II secretion system protein [Patescibacteria group bacterium]|nr:type II secretion system protein [Patescibacteria group bacterium]MDD5490663.1 type II secretion system protein [Patescibacteria group bacterium]
MTNKSKKGFTLIELLVVIAIIGLLSTLAVVALGSARAKGRDARRIADVKQYQTALEIFYADWGYYPGKESDGAKKLGADFKCLDNAGWGTDTCSGAQIYIKSVQPAPTPPQDNAYTYQALTCDTEGAKCDNYEIRFTLESPTQGLSAGVAVCSTPEGIKECAVE